MKVFLTSGHYKKWAIGDDLNLTLRAIKKHVNLVDSIEKAEIIHVIWWEALLKMNKENFVNKKIICHMTAEPNRYFQIPSFNKHLKLVDLWIAQSSQANEQMNKKNIPNYKVFYTADHNLFKPLQKKDLLYDEYHIPKNKYIISNFHRDTEGKGLQNGNSVCPKLVKGPDIFLEIIKKVYSNNKNIHILLAGPRRLWIKQNLKKHKIPFTYVGKEIDNIKDDMDINVLPQKSLNVLYNLSNLNIVSSRSEGGPRSILESSFSKCNIISTDVGIASDILKKEVIYNNIDMAVDLILKDININYLNNFIESNYNTCLKNCTIEAASNKFSKLYKNIYDMVK